MSVIWISQAKDVWGRTERLRSGLKAGIKTATLVAGSVRAITTAPVPEQPSMARLDTTVIARMIEREALNRLKEYSAYEINRLADQQRKLVGDLPARAVVDRTVRAVQPERSRSVHSRLQQRGR